MAQMQLVLRWITDGEKSIETTRNGVKEKLLQLSTSHLINIWPKLPKHYRNDAEIRSKVMCLEHNLEYDAVDGPLLKIFCYKCLNQINSNN